MVHEGVNLRLDRAAKLSPVLHHQEQAVEEKKYVLKMGIEFR